MDSPLGRYADEVVGMTVTVELLEAPLLLWQRAAEHHDELMREMALLALSSNGHALPPRLLELVDLLGRQHGAAGSRPQDERDAALARGADRLDLTYEVPRSAGEEGHRLAALLDEAEEFCRTDLLTLERPADQAAFSRWYIDQIVDQCQGRAPTPWPGPWS